MGCNSSKGVDIQQDRERRASGGIPRSKGIGIHGRHAEDEKQVYGTSWTEQHLLDQEALRDMIERTQQDFIDVTQEPLILDEKDVEERSKRYKALLEGDGKHRIADPTLIQQTLDAYFTHIASYHKNGANRSIAANLVPTEHCIPLQDPDGDPLVVPIDALSSSA